MNSTVKKKPWFFYYHKHPGFTLTEIIVACAIIITLGTAAVVGGGAILDHGRYNAAKGGVATISMAISQYHFELEKWPVKLSDLKAKVGQYGPWLEDDALKDPWGVDYQVYINSGAGTFAVWSYGPNKANNSGAAPTSFSGDDIGTLGH